tara:strand:+ start:292 stop:507 length:216 start_codon:yes stop_codon:yes gene_type:complete
MDYIPIVSGVVVFIVLYLLLLWRNKDSKKKWTNPNVMLKTLVPSGIAGAITGFGVYKYRAREELLDNFYDD